MNEFDEFTLSVMSNRNHYGKYLKTNTNAQMLADIFRKEKVYYNERIIELTRDLIAHEDAIQCTDNDVNESHNAYMKCCIRYLKWKDVTEMIQKEKYASDAADADGDTVDADADADAEDDSVSNARQELDKRIQETLLSKPDPVSSSPSSPSSSSSPSPPPPRYNQEKGLISFANKMCIRKKTMDDFIKIKPSPSSSLSSSNLPQIRDYHDEIAKQMPIDY